VGRSAIAQDVAGGIADTDVDSMLNMVKADNEWYSGWRVRLVPIGQGHADCPIAP
jgi:hypothetical protein